MKNLFFVSLFSSILAVPSAQAELKQACTNLFDRLMADKELSIHSDYGTFASPTAKKQIKGENKKVFWMGPDDGQSPLFVLDSENSDQPSIYVHFKKKHGPLFSGNSKDTPNYLRLVLNSDCKIELFVVENGQMLNGSGGKNIRIQSCEKQTDNEITNKLCEKYGSSFASAAPAPSPVRQDQSGRQAD